MGSARRPKLSVPLKRLYGLGFLAGLLVLSLLLHVGLGSALNIGPLKVLDELLKGPYGASGTDHFVIWTLRLPRAAGCVTVGMLLAGSGSAFQAVFRNPLADPYIVGTSSGAAVGGVISILIGAGWGWMGMTTPVFAFVGGMGSLFLVLAIARRNRTIDSSNLLLAGVLVGAMLSSLMAFLLYKAGQDTNQVTRWLLGSVDPMYWSRVGVMAVVLVLAGGWLCWKSRLLNALAMGEEASARLGVNVPRFRFGVLAAGAMMTAAAVGASGIIPFVGLAAPHTARRLLGVDWRFSLPASMLLGAIMMLLADALGARVVSDGIPVGVVTALLGAPFLLAILGRKG